MIPFKFTDSEASKHLIDPITIDTVPDDTLDTGADANHLKRTPLHVSPVAIGDAHDCVHFLVG